MSDQIVEGLVGNMFADKTNRLIRRVKTLREFGKKQIIVFKPTTDTRSRPGRIEGRGGEWVDAFEIPSPSPWQILRVLAEEEEKIGGKFDVVVVDEVQFFHHDIFRVAVHLISRGYSFIFAGLDLDFRGEPFNSTPLLMVLPRVRVHRLTAYCTKCGAEAPYPQRLLAGGSPAPYDAPQSEIDTGDNYEARCGAHHVVPGRPGPPWEEIFSELNAAGVSQGPPREEPPVC